MHEWKKFVFIKPWLYFFPWNTSYYSDLLKVNTRFVLSEISSQNINGNSQPCVVRRKSRSTAKENRIMKLYFLIDMTGQLHGHVTLTMWKLNKKRLSPFWKNAHEVERRSLLCLRIYTSFYGALTSKYFM